MPHCVLFLVHFIIVDDELLKKLKTFGGF